MSDDGQLVFEALWDELQSAVESEQKPKASIKRSVKRVRSIEYSVKLIHEEGVNWRLECYQAGEDEMSTEVYSHLASEVLKLEMLRLLKQDKPEKSAVYILSLLLMNLGQEVPSFLQVDTNKNLFEGDFWCDFESVDHKIFKAKSSSFLWAFYFRDFEVNEVVLSRQFSSIPAYETDIMILLDHEVVSATYPGLSLFL